MAVFFFTKNTAIFLYYVIAYCDDFTATLG